MIEDRHNQLRENYITAEMRLHVATLDEFGHPLLTLSDAEAQRCLVLADELVEAAADLIAFEREHGITPEPMPLATAERW